MDHGKCIHFNGIQNDLCKRGVAYKQFGANRPCVRFLHKSARGGTYLRPGEIPASSVPLFDESTGKACPFFEEPTAAQVQDDRREAEMALRKVEVAINVANKWRVKPKPDNNRYEVVECPVCKGNLSLAQSSYNGHCRGKCETDGCVEWME